MTRHLHLLAALLLLQLAASHAAAAAERQPNIVLILADDMGWGDLHCHGNDAIDTPTLDRLQRESVELERFFVSPVCSPTRASLLTGRHHLRLGVLNTTSGLEVMDSAEVTLAEVLGPAGYACGCFGKWHNGANDPSTATGQGFAEFLGFNGGFFSNYFDPALEHDGVAAERAGFITDVLADAALAFIEKHASRPFLCYVPFNACHSPMQAPADLFAKYRARGFEPKTAAVYAMVENLDANVGRMLGKLDALGIVGDTIVMFASDNGPNTPRFNGGMRGGKGSLFEGGQRVPCLIRWPGKLQAGRRVSQIAQHVDVLPTLVELAGVPVPQTQPLDGLSLAPLLRGAEASGSDRMLFEVSPRGGRDGAAIARHPGTARSQTHRWVHDGKQPMLFDLRDDPGETRDRSAEQPEIARALAAAYDAWFDQAVAPSAGRIRRLPIAVDTQAELLAPYATLDGGAKWFGQGWDNDWAVFPSNTASIAWHVDVTRSGLYECSVLHTAREPGGLVGVRLAEAGVETRVPAAHDPPAIPRRDLVQRWEVPDKAFAPLTIGRLEVSAGRQAVRVVAGPGVEIQSLRLRRVDRSTAALRLPSIFSDHMVLQSGKLVPVWGWAEPGEEVIVEFAGQSKSAAADRQGRWRVTLDALEPSAEPRSLLVRSPQRDRSVGVADVVVGEVWAGGGQSNMEFDMKSLVDGADEIEGSSNRMLRQFVVLKNPSAREPADDVPGFWTVARPGTTEDFIAAGYFFAKVIHQELQMPVGIIKVCWGGSKVEPWISPSTLATVPELATAMKNMNVMSDRNKQAFRDWVTRHGREDRTPADRDRFTTGPVSPDDGWVAVKDSGPAAHPSLPTLGAFWFRKDAVLSARQTGAVQVLQFGPSAQFDQVYWNGTLVGERTIDSFTGLISVRHYLIPPSLSREGVNQLAVRIYAPAVPPGFSWYPSLGGTKLLDGWMAKAEYPLPALDAGKETPVPNLTGQHVLPGRLFNGMVHPIVPYAIRGVLWYQGESNVGDPAGYQRSFPLVIQDWRRHWQQGDFPFYFCQLANFGAKATTPGESKWAELRAAQAQALSVPNTGMAVLIDTGESEDIHPQRKRVAGERLARIALAKTYGRTMPHAGPVYASMQIEAGKVRLAFDNVEGGLIAAAVPATYDVMVRGGKTEPLARNSPGSQLEGFAVCGEDNKWRWADAMIDDDTVVVWSADVPVPVAVRYGWSDNPTCNLYNTAGLPAVPFQTGGSATE